MLQSFGSVDAGSTCCCAEHLRFFDEDYLKPVCILTLNVILEIRFNFEDPGYHLWVMKNDVG